MTRARTSFNTRVGITTVVVLAATAVPPFGVVTARAQADPSYVVDNAGDEGDLLAGDGICKSLENTCTLRAAIEESNAATDGSVADTADAITFAIAGSGVHTISPASALPAVTNTVAIDAATQPGYAGTPLIQIDGSAAGASAAGLTIASDALGSDVRGLSITNFAAAGIDVQGGLALIEGNYVGVAPDGSSAGNGSGIDLDSDGNWINGGSDAGPNVVSANALVGISITGDFNDVAGNLIGTDAAGSEARPNQTGVWVNGSDNTIGDDRSNDGTPSNVISGNVIGISFDASATRNTVLGNNIGTNKTGDAALGNTGTGISSPFAASGNTIGSNRSATGIPSNVISGNGNVGIVFDNHNGALATNNVVVGNNIGTDVTGAAPIPNAGAGIYAGGSGHTIGGTSFAKSNLVAGNAGRGVSLGASDSFIAGNFIGLSLTTGSFVPNTGDGIRIGAGGGNRVGHPDSANVIAGNGGNGVSVETGTPTSSIGNRIEWNSIFDNGGLGIDLGEDGVTPNDDGDDVTPPDTDSGPNDLQNFPVIEAAGSTAADSTVAKVLLEGFLNTTPNTEIRITFFHVPTCDVSGNGEGTVALGAFATTTDGSGLVAFSNGFPESVPVGEFVTATATDTTTGNTSEFSACEQTVPLHELAVTTTGSGTVVSDPEGIDCGADCDELFIAGNDVTLTATPAEGSGFGGWDGACSGIDISCTVAMDAAKQVTATFVDFSCTYDAATRSADIDLFGQRTALSRATEGALLVGGLPCGDATVHNTDSVDVEGSAIAQKFILDLTGGGLPSIAIDADLHDGNDKLMIEGSDVAETAAFGTASAVALSSTPAITGTVQSEGEEPTVLFASNIERLRAAGGPGSDRLSFGGSDVLAPVGIPVTVRGGSGGDVLTGGDADDYIRGGTGWDNLWGMSGADVLLGAAGRDELYGQAGDDETLGGGPGADYIVGNDGRDTAYGLGGADTIFGGNPSAPPGSPESSGPAEDVLSGGSGPDFIAGGDGNDHIDGDSEVDQILGGSGNDFIRGDSDGDSIFGEDGNDVIRGARGSDGLYGGPGDDRIRGQLGGDHIVGNDGIDLLSGGHGNDRVFGGNPSDTVGSESSGPAFDTLMGGPGHDFLAGGDGDDTVEGGTGDDEVLGEAGLDVLSGGDDNDVISGGNGDDTLMGGAGNDRFDEGTDVNGADDLSGGDGDGDVVDYSMRPAAVEVKVTFDDVADDGQTLSDGGTEGDNARSDIEQAALADTPPTIAISDAASIIEGDAGTRIATFSVRISPAQDGEVSVGFSSADGTATAGADYVAAAGTVTFLPGEISKTITIDVIGDDVDETDESFFVNLAGATSGASITDSQGAALIVDDDDVVSPPPSNSPTAQPSTSPTPEPSSTPTPEPSSTPTPEPSDSPDDDVLGGIQVASRVSFDLKPRLGTAKGRVSAETRSCRVGRTVKLIRLRGGAKRVITTATSLRRGVWEIAELDRLRRGRYFVRVTHKTYVNRDGVEVSCQRARSGFERVSRAR